ncbi:hypothetical protein [Streptomyces xinghaiensis]|uniref:hypothetical protein n=1 Tax=Streptomyces xinghaiensis TaxID=1038928 RepID=UPI0006871BFE|nr:hypothetical protein [Streptomyces xinghaiensis]MZE75787.1 hypothetical protein [Streptomyces sp. SID5475]
MPRHPLNPAPFQKAGTDAFGLPVAEPLQPAGGARAGVKAARRSAGRRRGRRPRVVPYTVPWEGELPPLESAFVPRPGGGIAYPDEAPGDRYRDVLWARMTGDPGQGEPRFPDLHPGRQLATMSRLLCQVCGGQASHTRDGTLFLFQTPTGPSEDLPHGPGPDWPEGVRTRQPPLCLRCAPIARAQCPHLQDQCSAVRARSIRPVGACGTRFRTAGDRVVPVKSNVTLSFDAPATRYLLGAQLLVTLHGTTVVNLDRELQRAGTR